MDLDDAVAPGAKEGARAAQAECLPQLDAAQRERLLVRINPAGKTGIVRNCCWVLHGQKGLGAAMCSKSEGPRALCEVVTRLRSAGSFVRLIESLEGLYETNALVAVSRRAGLFLSIDGVTADTSHTDRLAGNTQRACAYAAGGKLCIHPKQVSNVSRGLSAALTELNLARRVSSGAAEHEGTGFEP